jgi:hypothetical protein
MRYEAHPEGSLSDGEARSVGIRRVDLIRRIPTGAPFAIPNSEAAIAGIECYDLPMQLSRADASDAFDGIGQRNREFRIGKVAPRGPHQRFLSSSRRRRKPSEQIVFINTATVGTLSNRFPVLT